MWSAMWSWLITTLSWISNNYKLEGTSRPDVLPISDSHSGKSWPTIGHGYRFQSFRLQGQQISESPKQWSWNGGQYLDRDGSSIGRPTCKRFQPTRAHAIPSRREALQRKWLPSRPRQGHQWSEHHAGHSGLSSHSETSRISTTNVTGGIRMNEEKVVHLTCWLGPPVRAQPWTDLLSRVSRSRAVPDFLLVKT